MTGPQQKASERKAKAIELRAAGLRNCEIAKQLGCSGPTVSTMLKGCGIPLPSIEHLRPHDRRRAKAMAAAFRSGKTLQAIGDEYGITRERVRQIINRLGVTRNDGGSHFAGELKLAKKAAAADEKCLRKYGCTVAQWKLLIALGRCFPRERSPVGAFRRQRDTAKNRGIAWNFTLWDWWTVWQESGKWSQRGRGQGYVMARRGDAGAYERGNVYITTAIENSSTGPHKKSGLPTGVSKIKGRFKANRMLNGIKHYIGTYETPDLAHIAYKQFPASVSAA